MSDKEKFLQFLDDNYTTIVVNKNSTNEYIEIDLIPDSKQVNINSYDDLVDSLIRNKIDFNMLNAYEKRTGDGIRMGRFFYYMVDTTKEIMKDYIKYKRVKNIKEILK